MHALKTRFTELYAETQADSRGEEFQLAKDLTTHCEQVHDELETLETRLAEERAAREEERSEWDTLQKDLLTAVSVANNFRSETEEKLSKLEEENVELKKVISELEVELDKCRISGVEKNGKPSSISSRPPMLEKKVSVKNLVKSIEKSTEPKPASSVKNLVENIENRKENK